MDMRFRQGPDGLRYTTVKRAPTKKAVFDFDTIDKKRSNILLFDSEYCLFKIYCKADQYASIPAGSILRIWVGEGPLYSHNGDVVEFTLPLTSGEDFTWTVALLVGVGELSLHLDNDVTADVEMSITPYERVEV